MTIKQTLAAIRALGVFARFNSEHQEFRVYTNRHPVEGEGYYTNDRDDALATAKHMAQAVGR